MNKCPLSFTAPALEHINKSLSRFPQGGFRLSIKKTGCSGYQYLPEIMRERKPGDLEFVTELGLKVFIDPFAAQWLKDTVVGLESKTLGQKQLVFNNPNARGMCGCGESFHLADEESHG